MHKKSDWILRDSRRKCLDVFTPLIDESLKGGIASGVEGTPTFFVNGVRYEESWDLETFSKTLKKHLTSRGGEYTAEFIHYEPTFNATRKGDKKVVHKSICSSCADEDAAADNHGPVPLCDQCAQLGEDEIIKRL